MPQVRPHQEINWLKNGSGWSLCPRRGAEEAEERRSRAGESRVAFSRRLSDRSVSGLSDIIIHQAWAAFLRCWQSRLFAFRFVHIHLLYLPKWHCLGDGLGFSAAASVHLRVHHALNKHNQKTHVTEVEHFILLSHVYVCSLKTLIGLLVLIILERKYLVTTKTPWTLL